MTNNPAKGMRINVNISLNIIQTNEKMADGIDDHDKNILMVLVIVLIFEEVSGNIRLKNA